MVVAKFILYLSHSKKALYKNIGNIKFLIKHIWYFPLHIKSLWLMKWYPNLKNIPDEQSIDKKKSNGIRKKCFSRRHAKWFNEAISAVLTFQGPVHTYLINFP